MRIEGSNVVLQSSRTAVSAERTEVRYEHQQPPLKRWEGHRLDDPHRHERQPGRDRVEWSHLALEAESVQVEAQGVVTTRDGRTIALGLRIDMQRMALVLAGGTLRGLPGGGGEAAGTTGRSVGVLATDAGVLGVDRDGDGTLGSASELLDGFGGLSALDGDGDGWLDEDDAAWSQVRLRDPATGESRSLREAGVGAVFTGGVSSRFGDAVRATGLLLYERGGVGTVQALDLTV